MLFQVDDWKDAYLNFVIRKESFMQRSERIEQLKVKKGPLCFADGSPALPPTRRALCTASASRSASPTSSWAAPHSAITNGKSWAWAGFFDHNCPLWNRGHFHHLQTATATHPCSWTSRKVNPRADWLAKAKPFPLFWMLTRARVYLQTCPHGNLSLTLVPAVLSPNNLQESLNFLLKKKISRDEELQIFISGFWWQIWEGMTFSVLFVCEGQKMSIFSLRLTQETVLWSRTCWSVLKGICLIL